MAQNNTYNDESITVLEGLEHVRKRPGMYIGSTDERGLHHLVWEIVDNAIDEALAGFGREISVIINEDNSITVEDNGRGVPSGMHKTGKNTMEIIYTKLNAGGKFNSNAYKASGGLHGVGASVVNALSSYMIVTSYRDGVIRQIRFSNGGVEVSNVEELGTTKKTGTILVNLSGRGDKDMDYIIEKQVQLLHLNQIQRFLQQLSITMTLLKQD